MGKKLVSKRLEHFISEKWQGKHCPMCQTGTWFVADMIYELREFNNGHLIIGGGPVIPIIPVFCDGCGHTMLINAYHAGVMND